MIKKILVKKIKRGGISMAMGALTIKDLDSELEKFTKRSLKDTNIGKDDARYLVDLYYQVQKLRISTSNQIRASERLTGESTEINNFFYNQFKIVEKQIVTILDVYTDRDEIGQWLKSIHGIGPVIASGLLAHLDITKAKTAGAFWRFAGLDPTVEWNKGEKRPWNARLKTLCWKAGQSFVKVSGNEKSLYGRLYREKKAEYTAKNENGGYAERCKDILSNKKFSKDTDAYKAYSVGKLPLGHIQAMAERYAVKIFLSHLFDFWYRKEYDKAPPVPFAIAHLDHVHIIDPEVVGY